MITISPKGVDFIKGFEAFRAKPYYFNDDEEARGIATIGYGTTRYPYGAAVKITDPEISEPRATDILRTTIVNFENRVRPNIRHVAMQHEWDAMISLAYNIGYDGFNKSTLLRYFNAGEIDKAADEFLKWNKQSGKVLAGLTRRRKAERDLFLGKA